MSYATISYISFLDCIYSVGFLYVSYYRLEEPIIKYSMVQKNGLHASESKPIWTKSGTM